MIAGGRASTPTLDFSILLTVKDSSLWNQVFEAGWLQDRVCITHEQGFFVACSQIAVMYSFRVCSSCPPALVRSSLLWVKPLVPPLRNGVSLCGLWSSWHMSPAQLLLSPCTRLGARHSSLPPPCPGGLVKWSQCTAIADALEDGEPGPVLSVLSMLTLGSS